MSNKAHVPRHKRVVQQPSPRLVPAVERAVRVLRALGANDGARRLSDLNRLLGLSKSTLSELLRTLEYYGFVERDGDSKAYRLGYALLELGHAVLRHLDLRQVAHPYLVDLRDATGETAVLHVPIDQGAFIVDRAESEHQLKVVAPLGHRLPPFAGSVAKVFLARLPDQKVGDLLKDRVIPAFTSDSITDPEHYRRELQRVRRWGYATDEEEYLPGVRAVSAPILDGRGQTVATITIVGFSARFTHKRLQEATMAVQEAATSISRQLGALSYPWSETTIAQVRRR